LAENVREAYGFLCANYEVGDEIILVGFSRGAFTARSIGALIQQVGLLTVEGMEDFYNIFKDWEEQDLGRTFEFRDAKGLQWEPENSTRKSSYTKCLEDVSILLTYRAPSRGTETHVVQSYKTRHQHQSHSMLRHGWCTRNTDTALGRTYKTIAAIQVASKTHAIFLR